MSVSGFAISNAAIIRLIVHNEEKSFDVPGENMSGVVLDLFVWLQLFIVIIVFYNTALKISCCVITVRLSANTFSFANNEVAFPLFDFKVDPIFPVAIIVGNSIHLV